MTRSLPPWTLRSRPVLVTLAAILTGLAFLFAGRGPFRAAEARPGQRLELRPGDHICLIGNTLADRMQHDGWLETLLQSRSPRHELVFRDLGFSGDELTTRQRSAGFGNPDEHLT